MDLLYMYTYTYKIILIIHTGCPVTKNQDPKTYTTRYNHLPDMPERSTVIVIVNIFIFYAI